MLPTQLVNWFSSNSPASCGDSGELGTAQLLCGAVRATLCAPAALGELHFPVLVLPVGLGISEVLRILSCPQDQQAGGSAVLVTT